MTSAYKHHQYHLGLFLGFGALLWNGTYNALAKGLTPFLSPVTLLLLSEGLTAIFILMTFGFFPLLHEFRKMDRRSIWISMLIGLLCSAVAPLLFFTGLARTSAINASMLSSADIIIILLGAHFILKEKVSHMQILGGSIVMLGVVIVNVAGTGVPSSVHIGDLFIVAGSLFFGTGAVLFKKYLSHMMPELAILFRNISAIVIISFFALFFH
ncbi:EamA family transporter, partial [Candidatus Peribacteria bacterium]|nr:EamA family transporter [Candidatus Peribacteria bacterium]